jgi:molybdopterin-guanine dinucleotide biosynthesis protein A
MPEAMSPLLGIFVGGQAKRMGGLPKGLLPAPDTGEPLVVRLARIAVELGCEPVLVGAAEQYAAVLPELMSVPDRPPGVGPLGGLSGLLHAAGERQVIAVACDMPAISRALLARLLTEQPTASILAARNSVGFWEPLCARYDASAVAPRCALALARGVRSFQQWFLELEVNELPLEDAEREQFGDWDTPEDIGRLP